MEQRNTLPHSYIHRWKKYMNRVRKMSGAKAQMNIAIDGAVSGRAKMQSRVPL